MYPDHLTENEKVVVGFLRLMETRQGPEDLKQFYHPDIEQIEYPNAITRNTAFRNMAALQEGSEKGMQLMSREDYEIKKLHAIGDTVILEAVWKGTLRIPVGHIPAGGQMTAYFAQFFEIKDGKIYRQRNYDCFEPFT
jgi:ketosteroid isomerase-like protein